MKKTLRIILSSLVFSTGLFVSLIVYNGLEEKSLFLAVILWFFSFFSSAMLSFDCLEKGD